MKRLIVISIAVVGLTLTLVAQQAPPRPVNPEHPSELTGEFVAMASPELVKGPVPRLADGHPDLSGPWVGGGSNAFMDKIQNDFFFEVVNSNVVPVLERLVAFFIAPCKSTLFRAEEI